VAGADHAGVDDALADATVILRHTGFDPDDAVQRSRTMMGNGWIRIAAQLGEVLDS
jgi:hypothetical protein